MDLSSSVPEEMTAPKNEPKKEETIQEASKKSILHEIPDFRDEYCLSVVYYISEKE